MRKLRLRPMAKNDLDSIWAFTFEHWGQAQATNYLEKIKRTLYLVASNPHIGQPRETITAGLQVFTVEKHMPCYLVDVHQIDVLRILHTRMDLEGHLPLPLPNLKVKH